MPTYGGAEVNYQNYLTPGASQTPVTLSTAAAATITPTGFITVLTGTTQVATINLPYVSFSGMICLIFTDGSPGATLTSGNIAIATTVVSKKALYMTYEPVTAKWYPSY